MTSVAGAAPHVVIVGGGFGGLIAAKSLARAPVRVTLVDRSNHHLFQPLLYQVAMAGLSPAEIAVPIRSVLRRQANVRVLLAEVTGVELGAHRISVSDMDEIEYDFLVLAAGARTSYFGHDEWSRYAIGLKDLDDAVEIRRRVLLAFEAAEREDGAEARKRLLTFVVIGGGPTGVELAGALAELSRFALSRDFRVINPRDTRVLLLEGGDRILSPFDPKLSESAVRQLRELGVEVRTGARVTAVDELGVSLGDERIEAATVLWGAGICGTPLAETLGVELDRAGRVPVEPDCSLAGHPNVFAIGDMASCKGADGRPLPGLSPVAMQQARAVAKSIERTLAGREREPFSYFDKGTMATIGRSRAIAQVRSLQLSGFLAWCAWLFVHIWYLIGFRNRFLVMFSWFWSYVTYKRGARLVTGHRLEPGPPPRRSMY